MGDGQKKALKPIAGIRIRCGVKKFSKSGNKGPRKQWVLGQNFSGLYFPWEKLSLSGKLTVRKGKIVDTCGQNFPNPGH